MHFRGLASSGANSWFGLRFVNHQIADELWLCYCFCLYSVSEVWSFTFRTDYKQLNLTVECENQDGCKCACD